MNKKNKKLVLNKVKEYDIANPGVFFFKKHRALLSKKAGVRMSNKDLILNVLRTSMLDSTYYFYNGEMQCYRSRRRSSYDIWKICRFYKKTITIFSVMKILYNVVMERRQINFRHNYYYINTNYCHDVKRKVFYLSTICRINNEFYNDEYGLTFHEWN